MGASNRNINNDLPQVISWEGADYLYVTIMCPIFSDDEVVPDRDNSATMLCGFFLFVILYICLCPCRGIVRVLRVHLECVQNLGVAIRDGDIGDLGQDFYKEFLDIFV